MSAGVHRSYNNYDGNNSADERDTKLPYERGPYYKSKTVNDSDGDEDYHHQPSTNRRDSDKSKKNLSRTSTQQHTPPESPRRTNTRRYINEDGDEVVEADGDIEHRRVNAQGWVTSDEEDDEEHYIEKGRKASKSKTKKRSSVENSRINGGRADPITKRRNQDGDDVETWEGKHSPRVTTHSDPARDREAEERLFGKAASADRRRSSREDDEQEDYTIEHTGPTLPRVRTHSDESKEDEINERLFGKGAVVKPKKKSGSGAGGNSPPRRSPTSRFTKDREGNDVEEATGKEPLRTHDLDDQNAINERLFGKGARNAY